MKNLKNKRPAQLILIGLLAVSFFLMNGCASKRILKKYYVLEPSLTPVLADSVQYRQLPYSVLVNPLTVRPAFKTRQIALRSKSNELQYYIYHVWGEPLDDALRFFIWRRLEILKVFRESSIELTTKAPQYMIDGTIDLLEWQKPTGKIKKPVAHIQMVLDFKDFRTGKILVEHAFDRSEPLPKKSSMNDFVVAVNRILNGEVDTFIRKIISKLEEDMAGHERNNP